MTTYSSEAQRKLDAMPPAKEPVTYTPSWAIEKYISIRDEDREDTKAYDARCAQRKVHMALLESYLLSEMTDEPRKSPGAIISDQQIKTSAGTAYKSPQMHVKMVDRQAVIEKIVEEIIAWTHPGIESMDEVMLHVASFFDVFTNHVNKDWVKQQLDANINPDGIEVRRFIACNVRKA